MAQYKYVRQEDPFDSRYVIDKSAADIEAIQNRKAEIDSMREIDDYVRMSNANKRAQGTTDHSYNYEEAESQSQQQAKANNRPAILGGLDKDKIRILQQQLGVDADGIIGSQTIRALQNKLGLNADGKVNNATIKQIQNMVGASTDGILGDNTLDRILSTITDNKQLEQRSPMKALFGTPDDLKLEDGQPQQQRISYVPKFENDYSDIVSRLAPREDEDI